MSYADKTLTCRDCGQDFVFSAGEQEFHASRGFSNEPGRCKDCRAARKSERAGSAGGYGSGGYGSGGGYGRQERQMYSATCATCGQEARVPFEPRGDKPVYCSNCYTPRQSGGYGGRGYR